MKNTELKETVDHLLEVLNERKLGYGKAAENVDNSAYKQVFQEYSQQAGRFADELVPFSTKSGSDEAGTRPQGDAWRVWMDLKSALTGGSADSMISASIKGEKDAISNFEEALKNEDVGQELKGILSKQLAEMKTACNRLEKLK